MSQIRGLINRVKNSPFLKGVLVIAGGTAAAQTIGVLVSPFLTRLYSPDAMGLWGMFISFVGVSSVLGGMRYDVAIVAANDDQEALIITKSSLYVAAGFSVIAGIVFEIFRRSRVLGYGAFPPWVSLLVMIATIITTWIVILRYWAIRQGKYSAIGKFTMTQAFARAAFQILTAFITIYGLALGEVAGRLGGLFVIWRTLPRSPRVSFSLETLLKYKTYPLIQLPSSFLDTVALMAPVPVFSAVYGIAVGGGLALAQRVVGLPLSLVGASVADVFYGKAAQISRENPQYLIRFLLSTVLRLGIMAVILGILMWLIAPAVVTYVFGPHWKQAGRMMAALAPWLVAMLTVSPVTRIIFLSRHSWIKLLYDSISIAIVAAPFWLHISDPVRALSVVSWLKATQYLLYLLLLIILSAIIASENRSSASVER